MNVRIIKPPRQPGPPPDGPVDGLRRAPVVVLDWAAYFREFCAAHTVRGGGYVVDGGRLLFGDGWTAAADDHRGPYLPPPADPLLLTRLLGRYWRRRLRIVRAELKKATDTLEGLDELRRNYPLPLTARRVLVTETGAAAVDPNDPYGPVDWAALANRVRWLGRDALDCEAELRSLGESP